MLAVDAVLPVQCESERALFSLLIPAGSWFSHPLVIVAGCRGGAWPESVPDGGTDLRSETSSQGRNECAIAAAAARPVLKLAWSR